MMASKDNLMLALMVRQNYDKLLKKYRLVERPVGAPKGNEDLSFLAGDQSALALQLGIHSTASAGPLSSALSIQGNPQKFHQEAGGISPLAAAVSAVAKTAMSSNRIPPAVSEGHGASPQKTAISSAVVEKQACLPQTAREERSKVASLISLGTKPKNFPQLLMRVLMEPMCSGIIEWNRDGTKFHIINSARFAKEILPAHFNNCKFSSFARKLNRWGFKYDREGRSYSNKSFLRDDHRLLQQMFTCEGKVRKMESTSKKNKGKEVLALLLDQAKDNDSTSPSSEGAILAGKNSGCDDNVGSA